MKKVILLIVLALSIMSCKSNKPVVTNTKVDSRSNAALKGEWTLTSVTYPGSEYIKITSFGIADSKCFEGSAWKFVPNNDTGEMTITAANCPSFSSPIKWFVNKDKEFVLKIVNAGEKAKKVRDGYILKMGTQTTENFELIDNINVGNKPTNVVYSFVKVK